MVLGLRGVGAEGLGFKLSFFFQGLGFMLVGFMVSWSHKRHGAPSFYPQYEVGFRVYSMPGLGLTTPNGGLKNHRNKGLGF